MSTFREIRSIACVGEVMIELIAAPDGTARLGVAGDTFNTAVYLARALRDTPISVSYVTALGRDPYSNRILDAIRRHGLDASFIEWRDDRMPGLYAIDTDDAGERSFSYWRSASAARTLFTPPCDITLDSLHAFDMILFSGISLAILPPDIRARVIGFCNAFRDGGGQIAYDSNHRPRLWDSDDTARDVNSKMWAVADIALPSVDDEMALFGDADADTARARLAALGAIKGAIKRGADGPMDLATGQVCRPDVGPIRVVDTTAAGDSFNAAYLATIAKGGSPADAAEAGHRLAARVIGAPGAIIDNN